jgi:cell division protease FtsH
VLELEKAFLEGGYLREKLSQAQAPDEMDEWLRNGQLDADKPLLQTLLV